MRVPNLKHWGILDCWATQLIKEAGHEATNHEVLHVQCRLRRQTGAFLFTYLTPCPAPRLG